MDTDRGLALPRLSELGVMTGTAPRHPKYPHLLQPLEVAGMTMPNRSIMGSMHMGLEEEQGGFTKLAKFYAERAEGGAGLIVTGGISPNRAGKLAPHGAALMRSSQSGQAPGGDRCCARSRWPHCPADSARRALQLPSFLRRALQGQGAHQQVQPVGAQWKGRGTDHPCLRALRRAGA